MIDGRVRGWGWFDRRVIFEGYPSIVGPSGMSVYMALLAHADIDTGECYPLVDTLARESGISERQVVRVIHGYEKGAQSKFISLTEAGLIRVERITGDKNRFVILNLSASSNSEGIDPAAPAEAHDESEAERENAPVSAAQAPLSPGGDAVQASGDAVQASGDAVQAPPSDIEQESLNQSLLTREARPDSELCTDGPECGLASPPKANDPSPAPSAIDTSHRAALEEENKRWFDALCDCCAIDPSTVSEGDAASRALGEAMIQLRSRKVRPSDLPMFSRWWREVFMPRGTAPRCGQVVTEWRRFSEWRQGRAKAGGFHNEKHAATSPNRPPVMPATEEEIAEKEASLAREKARLSEADREAILAVKQRFGSRPRHRGGEAVRVGELLGGGSGGDPPGERGRRS